MLIRDSQGDTKKSRCQSQRSFNPNHTTSSADLWPLKMTPCGRVLLRLTLTVLLLSACCHGYGSRRPKGRVPSYDHTQTGARTCSVTKGSKLTSFLGGKAYLQLPCRYILTEVMCHMKTRVTVESSFARDGSTYISFVSVNKSRGMQSPNGIVQDFDEASISMADFKDFLETGKLDKTHWTSTGEAHFWNGKQKYRLQGTYDADAGQTVLSDGSEQVHVYFSYLNSETDPGKDGNLSFVCKSLGFGAAPGSSGYLCGNAGNLQQKADKKGHLKKAAQALKLRTADYVTYNILVQQDVPQTNPMCQEAVDLTRKCSDPVQAVKVCGSLLDRRQYAKCFMQNNLDPLQAFVNCLKSGCRKNTGACKSLKAALEVCPGKMLKSLPCAADSTE